MPTISNSAVTKTGRIDALTDRDDALMSSHSANLLQRPDDVGAQPWNLFFSSRRTGYPFLDDRGNYYAGGADGSQVALIAAGDREPRVARPHIAALRGRTTFSGFTDRGSLIFLGGR